MGVLVIFNLEATEADIELVGSLFDEQPYKRVSDIARRWQAQINAQLQTAQEALAAEQKAALDQHVDAELAKRVSPEPPASAPAEG